METLMNVSSNTAKMHEMFGKNLYSERYSFVAEICQNAVDSHRMAKQTNPVLVGIRKDEMGKFVFYVKDTGLSFDSREDFINKVCTIMESGKDSNKTNDEDCPMGGHGIGSISVSRFYDGCEWRYTVVKDNRKFQAKIHEVEGVGIVHSVGDYVETEEDKYVLFEVDIPDQRLYQEIGDLVIGLRSKLCYFKDIKFEFDTATITAINLKSLLTINTDFKLIQSDDWQHSTLSDRTEMHISLDQYSYAINWKALNIKPINLNIALKFRLNDGLSASITREVIKVNSDYKQIVMEKIEKVADWFANKYNEGIPEEFESIRAVKPYLMPSKKVVLGEMTATIDQLLPFSKVKILPIKFKGVSSFILDKLAVPAIMDEVFNCKYVINSSGRKYTAYYSYYSDVANINAFLLDEKGLPKKYITHFKQQGKDYYFFVKKQLKLKNYVHLLGLKSNKDVMRQIYKASGRNIWREYISQFQILENCATKELYKNIFDVPLAVSARKKVTRNIKTKVDLSDMSGEVGIKYGQPLKLYSSEWNCKFTEKIELVRDLYKLKFLHVYGSDKDRPLLDNLFCLSGFGTQTTFKVCIIAEKNHKHIEELKLHNFMNVEEFFKGKHRYFGRIVTAKMINNMIGDNLQIFAHSTLIKDSLSSKFGTDLLTLSTYAKKWGNQNVDKAFMDSCEQLMIDAKLYDHEIWDTFKNVEKHIAKFEFISLFSPYMRNNHPERDRAIIAMMDIAKQRKVRMDWGKYKLLEDEFNINQGL